MIRVTTAGESHGPCLTVVVEGLPSGLHLDGDLIREDLARRQIALGAGGRMAIASPLPLTLAVQPPAPTNAPLASRRNSTIPTSGSLSR